MTPTAWRLGQFGSVTVYLGTNFKARLAMFGSLEMGQGHGHCRAGRHLSELASLADLQILTR